MMKKLLLLTLLAVSANAFSQGGGSSSGWPISIDNFLHPSQSGLHEVDHEIYGKSAEIDLRTMPDDQYGMILPPVQLFDAVMHWKWDTISDDWKLNNRISDINYDSAYNLTDYTGQTWNGNAWVNSVQRSLLYNERNIQTLSVYQAWNGTDWVNTLQEISTYDANNQLEVWTRQPWKEMLWENSKQNQYYYDSNRNLVNEVHRSWFVDQWVGDNQELYTYDAHQNLVSQTSQQWNGSSWENTELVVNTYDTNNNLTTTIEKKWNVRSWDNLSQRLYGYDSGNNLISLNVQTWSIATWKDTDRVMYAYDANDNLRDVLSQKYINATWENFKQQQLTHGANHNLISHFIWQWIGDEWVISSKLKDTYDPDFYLTSETFKGYGPDGTVVTNGDSTHNYFTIIIATDELANTDDQIIIYPNPSGGKFTISRAEADAVEVFNIAGKRVYVAALSAEQASIEMDLTYLGAGIYFVVLHNGRKTHSRKIEIQ